VPEYYLKLILNILMSDNFRKQKDFNLLQPKFLDKLLDFLAKQ